VINLRVTNCPRRRACAFGEKMSQGCRKRHVKGVMDIARKLDIALAEHWRWCQSAWTFGVERVVSQYE
jgi:hypothetical protein